MRVRFFWIAAAAIIIGGGIAVLFLSQDVPVAQQIPDGARLPPATAQVTRGPLVETRTVTGTLGYGDVSSVRPRLRSGTGMVTWLAQEDEIIERGEPLFAIDGRPAIVFYGDAPQYRTLRFEADGVEWVELETLRAEVAAGQLKRALEEARRADAENRLADAQMRFEDSLAEEPSMPEFIDLAGTIEAAEDRLERVRQLVNANASPSVEVVTAERELAAARAALEVARRSARQEVSLARIDLATSRESLATAELALQDLQDRLTLLEAQKSDGSDIAQIEQNLDALGYTGSTVEMVLAWQADAGLPTTGIVEPGHIFVVPEAVKVAAHVSSIGETISDNSPDRLTVLDYTDTKRSVSVPLAVADRSLAVQDDTVVVTLPDGSEVEGIVATVGAVVTEGEIEVTIDIPDQAALGTLDIASVDVQFISDRRDDVLSVPVTALLAQADGSFAVEVVEGSSSRITPIETGLFAAGRVEVSGADMAEGVAVGVPG